MGLADWAVLLFVPANRFKFLAILGFFPLFFSKFEYHLSPLPVSSEWSREWELHGYIQTLIPAMFSDSGMSQFSF